MTDTAEGIVPSLAYADTREIECVICGKRVTAIIGGGAEIANVCGLAHLIMLQGLPPTLYVAAAWHADCDPFVRVIATSADACEREINEAIADERASVFACDCDETCDPAECETHDPDIRWSGVFAETRASVIAGEYSGDRERIIADLVESGTAYGGTV